MQLERYIINWWGPCSIEDVLPNPIVNCHLTGSNFRLFDIGGGGDFSVVIRTAVKGASDKEDVESWRIGAGGAVTIQSSDLGEFLEMETKVTSALGAFTKVEV